MVVREEIKWAQILTQGEKPCNAPIVTIKTIWKLTYMLTVSVRACWNVANAEPY